MPDAEARQIKTVFLVFIHGFRGTNETFLSFPTHLASLLTSSLHASNPAISVQSLVYPAFETRGDLLQAVQNFREWLLNKVIDSEVANGSHSPTLAPSVRCILIGHSMGGIVAAEAALGIVQDGSEEVVGHAPTEETADGERVEGLPSNKTTVHHAPSQSEPNHAGKMMFPYIQGILAFDTPYLGISPGVVAHGAEEQWATGKKWFDAASGLFAAGTAAGGAAKVGAEEAKRKEKASAEVPKGEEVGTKKQSGAAWQKWGRAALFAGAATTAIAGAGAAAWMGREHITEGVSWATSHLQFVGSLARKEELRRRVEGVIGLEKEHDVGYANLYTVLGKGAESGTKEAGSSWSKRLMGNERTFCLQPGRWAVEGTVVGERWHAAKNDMAASEVDAHMYMFCRCLPPLANNKPLMTILKQEKPTPATMQWRAKPFN